MEKLGACWCCDPEGQHCKYSNGVSPDCQDDPLLMPSRRPLEDEDEDDWPED